MIADVALWWLDVEMGNKRTIASVKGNLNYMLGYVSAHKLPQMLSFSHKGIRSATGFRR